jgi:hypothetical protein
MAFFHSNVALTNSQKFPWIKQIEIANQTQKCAPTLSVKDLKTSTDFWVSMAGDKNEHKFLIGYVYYKTVKGFFWLWKTKRKKMG